MMSGSAGSERRQVPRVQVDHRVVLSIDGQPEHAGVLKDISGTGCFFATAAVVEDGWTVRMSFRLRPQGVCEARGRIVRRSSNGFGVRFDSINRMLHGVIVTLLAARPEQRSSILAEISEAMIEIGRFEVPRGS
jgi:hypothetical protein